MSLDGKVVIVTGGASGIGRASAELMALRGAAVVIADEEVAQVVAFLASDDSSHLLAGQTVHTNGGVFMGF